MNPRPSAQRPELPRRSPVLLAVAVLSLLLSLACQTHYRSAVAWPGDSVPSATTIASAGVRRSQGGMRDEAASVLLREKSGYADVGPSLSDEDLGKLLSDPAGLARSAAWRIGLAKRIGYRNLVVGDITQIEVEASKEWIAVVGGVYGVAIPFPHGRRSDVPIPTFALRVIDLTTGRIQSEFFAMMPSDFATEGLSDHHLETALRAMGLAEEPR